MVENNTSKLLKCIPPKSLKKHTRDDMWVELQTPKKYNNLTAGVILHVKNEIILKLDEIKECVKTNNLEMESFKDEWIIYEPRKN